MADQSQVSPKITEDIFEDDLVKIAVGVSDDEFLEDEFDLSDVENCNRASNHDQEASTLTGRPVVVPVTTGVNIASIPPLQLLMQSPELQDMLQHMVKEGVKSALQQQAVTGVAVATPPNKEGKSQTGNLLQQNIKSLSDTTIYTKQLTSSGK